MVGLGVVAIYTVFTLAGRTPMAAARGRMLGGFALSALATMLTPAGPAGILYPLRYVDAGDWGLANIQEWQSPNFHDPAHWAFLLLIVALIANGGRRAPGWLVVLSWVRRRGRPRLAAQHPARRHPRRAGARDRDRVALRRAAAASGRRASPARRRLMEMGAAALVVVAAFAVLWPGAKPAIREDDYPAAAMNVLTGTMPKARLLAEYGWGGYAISRLFPTGGRVFVDGRNDMYDQRILEDYSHIRGADSGWQALASRYGVEAMLFPPGAPITKGPATDDGWCEAYRNDSQVLLVPCS